MFFIQMAVPINQLWSYYVIIVTMFIQGIASDGRKSLGFAYFVELAPKSWTNILGTSWNISEYALINIYVTTYFRFVSKSWIGTIYISLGLALTSLIVVFSLIPESPKWLYSKERYEDLGDVLRFMARINGKKLEGDNTINQLALQNEMAIDVNIVEEGDAGFFGA